MYGSQKGILSLTVSISHLSPCKADPLTLSPFQFVAFREFIGGRYGNDLLTSQAYLAKEVLAEIPDQITGYMKRNRISPGRPTAPPGGGDANGPGRR